MSRKVERLPGTRLTPETMLAMTLEAAKAGQIDRLLIAHMKPDGTVDVGWSEGNTGQLTFMAKIIDIEIEDTIRCPHCNASDYDEPPEAG